MIKSLKSINFKSTYVNSSYKKMSKSQQRVVGDIISTLQTSDNEEGISLERKYEKIGKDFYITKGYENNVDLFVVKTKDDDVIEGSDVLIGRYNLENSFEAGQVENRLILDKLGKFAKFGFAILLLSLYLFGGVKACSNNAVAKQLPNKVLTKMIGH